MFTMMQLAVSLVAILFVHHNALSFLIITCQQRYPSSFTSATTRRKVSRANDAGEKRSTFSSRIMEASATTSTSSDAAGSCSRVGGGEGNNNKKDGGSQQCVPCSSMDPSHLLSGDEVRRRLSSEFPLWNYLDGETDGTRESSPRITRKFTAKNFQCALDCINDVGAVAERENHHPDIHLTQYRDVEIVLYTHKLGGVTEADLAFARMIDEEVKVVYSPKWLKDHPGASETSE